MKVLYRYFHFYFLLRFVTKKTFMLVCEVCNTGMPKTAKEVEAEIGKGPNPIPWLDRYGWSIPFIALAGLIALIGILLLIPSSPKPAKATQDPVAEAAPKTLESLAMNGDADAQLQLGEQLEQGQGSEPNTTKAAFWYRKAAEQGDAEGQHRLAQLYHTGKGGVADPVIAYLLINLAAVGGNPDWVQQRNDWGKQLSNPQLKEAQLLARNWKPGTALPLKSTTGAPQ